MRKIISLLLAGIFILTIFGAVASSNKVAESFQKSIDENTLIFTESLPNISEYQIVNEDNKQRIVIDGFNNIQELGKPILPSKNLMIALPPGAKVKSVKIVGGELQQIPGIFEIKPTDYILPIDNLGQISIKEFKTQWELNYESIYFSDKPYPIEPGKYISSGYFRKYSYVLVTIFPLKYHPKSGRLFCYDSVDVVIDFASCYETEIEKMKKDTVADQAASEIFVNFESIKFLYISEEKSKATKDDIYDYVIITDNDLVDTVSSSSFVSWKETVGYNTKIVKTSDSEIQGQTGVDLAEKIRNFLREYYFEWGIEYVLIVGDYETVPMRYCYPDPTNHLNTVGTPGGAGGDVPTDYYYADLSSSDAESWDYDGDGYHGEYGHDQPDFAPEVYVGRIPINDESRISYTLDKLVAFEQDTGSWKQNALHVGAFFYFTNEDGSGNPAMDGATCCAYIQDDFMDGWTVSRYSEQEGLEKSIYPWSLMNEPAFSNDWRTGQYSIVNWGAHGWTNLIARKVWSWDDGDEVPEANEIDWPTLLSTSSNLDDDYPSIVTCISCYVGYPEPNSWGNFGIDLLTKPSYGASVGVIASARSPYGTINWPSNPGASYSIIYEFNRYLINNSEKVGQAFYDSKHYCNVNFNWYGWVEYNDLYTFNLFGDPSLTLEGINIGGKPDKPATPEGPPTGNTKEEYTYTSSTTDPDNDQLYYLFSWGDGTDSGWIGPFESGGECEASHIWNKKGDYEVKVRAKDTKDLLSEWSDPLRISMPKNNPVSSLLTEFFQNHPILFKLIQILDKLMLLK